MPDLAMLDYFYGDEAEQFTFYRIPKVLFTDPSYRRISSDAKILYGLMLDRMGLSVRNGWLDEYNRVFIFFTLEDALEYLCCGHTKVSTETLEQTYERIRTLHEIQEALNEFTPKQRRRFLLHFAYGYTYMEMLIRTLAPMALQNIWRIMEYEKSSGRMERILCLMPI